MTTPVFILSLPRSGSTLLQRILAVHREIETAPEPWILLPLGYVLKGQGAYAEYGHSLAVKAIHAFCEGLPNQYGDYEEAIRRYGEYLYSKVAPEKRYFVDKTPRYHLIAPELIQVFPDARFIFLFRNPLAILASMRRAWRLVHLLRVDLYAGLDSLLQASSKAGDGAHRLRYEDLVSSPQSEIKDICSYLHIEFDPAMLTDFENIRIPEGAFGNPADAHSSVGFENSSIREESIRRWEHELTRNFIRKASASRYLHWVGEARLSSMGYSFEEIHSRLNGRPPGIEGIGSDLLEIIRGMVSVMFETHIMRDKLGKLPHSKFIYSHR